MQLRNGKRLRAADEAEGSNMDASSTQAELGSPHHTNSFSTINSASTLPPTSQPGPSTSAGQPQLEPPSQAHQSGQRLHQSIPHPHRDFILYPAADEEEYADSQASQEQVPGQDSPHQQPLSATSSSSSPAFSGTRFQDNDDTPLAFPNNGSVTSSTPQLTPAVVPPPDPPQTPRALDTEGEHRPSLAAIQQWGTPPWTSLSHAAEALHEPAEAQYPPDRNYPDKMEEDLEKLRNRATNSDGDDEDDQQNGEKKVGKGKGKGKGTKRRGTRSPSRGPDRQDKRHRGGGDDGNGITV